MHVTFDSLKTFYDILVQKLKNHRGNWNQNDPTADDYIKNRPFYVETKSITLVDNLIHSAYNNGEHPSCTFVAGQTYNVTWNGTLYENIVCTLVNGWHTLTSDAFYIDDDGGNNLYVEANEDTEWTLSISTIQEVVKKLDKKFIDMPDDIITSEELNDVIDNIDNQINNLSSVAFSGNYYDLNNRPTVYTDAVRYSSQTLTDAEKQIARNNIGAGTSNFSGNYADLTNAPKILQANWEMYNPDSNAYIANKPFGYEYELEDFSLSSTEIEKLCSGIFDENTGLYVTTIIFSKLPPFDTFEDYYFAVNGKPNISKFCQYRVSEYNTSELYLGVGNASLTWGADGLGGLRDYKLYQEQNGQSWYNVKDTGEDWFLGRTNNPKGTYYTFITRKPNIQITDIHKILSETVNQLDEKYIPDTIARIDNILQSDWNQNDETAIDFIKNKPTLTTTTTAGLMSASDKTKLDGIEAGANATEIDSTLSIEGAAADAKAVGNIGKIVDTLYKGLEAQHILDQSIMDKYWWYVPLNAPKIEVYYQGSLIKTFNRTSMSTSNGANMWKYGNDEEADATAFFDTYSGSDYVRWYYDESGNSVTTEYQEREVKLKEGKGKYLTYMFGYLAYLDEEGNWVRPNDWFPISCAEEGNFAKAMNFALKYSLAISELATEEYVDEVQSYADEAYSMANDAYTKAENAQSTADSAKTIANAKMNKSNPVGTGSFSMQRKSETTVGSFSHTEGYDGTASGYASHSEGIYTIASGNYSHAEGQQTTASGETSHAEGFSTKAEGVRSHAEGASTVASGYASHSEGIYTIASGNYSHVQGEYNIADSDSIYAHIVGNGKGSNVRSNAHTLDWEGNAWFAGDVYVGSTSGTNKDEGSKKLATEEYVNECTAIQPDWNQNDETELDYIKNRTHWTEPEYETVVPLQTTTGQHPIIELGTFYDGDSFDFPEDAVFVIDGISYEVSNWYDDLGFVGEKAYGDSRLSGWDVNKNSHPEDVPFCALFTFYDENINGIHWGNGSVYELYIDFPEDKEHTVEVKKRVGTVYHKLDINYLPIDDIYNSIMDRIPNAEEASF